MGKNLKDFEGKKHYYPISSIFSILKREENEEADDDNNLHSTRDTPCHEGLADGENCIAGGSFDILSSQPCLFRQGD